LYNVILKRFNAASVAADQWDAKLESLVWRLHPPEAVRDLKVRASASLLSAKDRSKAVTALAFINTPAAVKAMIDLSSDDSEVIADQATYWLAFRQGNDWLALWDWRKTGIDLEHDRAVAAMKVKRNRILDSRMPANEKSSNARDMARNPVGAQMLLGMVSANQIPDELSSYVKTLLMGSHDPAVRMQAASYFNTEVDAKSYSIPSIVKLAADASKGKELFARNCSTCHRIHGFGATIGPDLSGISGKFDRTTLLDNIVNPGAGIVFGYEPWTIRLKDGQSFFGFMVADGSTHVTIRDLSGKNHVIDSSQIAERKKQDGSLMPEPSVLGLSEQDLANISAYLMSVK
jgi:putative heme-binding domain-containing protein